MLPITVRVGATLPLLESSAGRVFLAFMPRSLTDPVLASSNTDADLTAEQIGPIQREVVRTGVAETTDGVIPGLVTLAAPVFTAGSSLPLAVALTLPKSLSTPALPEEVRRELLVTTHERAPGRR